MPHSRAMAHAFCPCTYTQPHNDNQEQLTLIANSVYSRQLTSIILYNLYKLKSGGSYSTHFTDKAIEGHRKEVIYLY